MVSADYQKLKKYILKHYHDNKDSINEKRRELILCETCNKYYMKCSMLTHTKTKKHLKNLLSLS